MSLRERSSKRDLSIRKKLEREGLKRNSPYTSSRTSLLKDKENLNVNISTQSANIPASEKKSRKRSVSDLNPLLPTLMIHSSTLSEISSCMALNKVDCVLIVKESTLVGIITDKDIMKCISNKLNPSSACVESVMTKNPMTIFPDETAMNALKLMVERKFRHLPVIERGTGRVIGLIDISKSLFDVTDRMEKHLAASKLIRDDDDFLSSTTLDSVHKEFYSEIENRLFKPTLHTLLASQNSTPNVSMKASVETAVMEMIKSKTNACLIVNASNDVIGIFTSKDLVLRVIAASLPFNTTIVRVMTPSPDVISSDTSIIEAINYMKKKHYLHLPLCDKDKKIIGMCDISQLSFYVLMNTSSGSFEQNQDSKDYQFWTSAFSLKNTNSHNDSNSLVSDDTSVLERQRLLDDDEESVLIQEENLEREQIDEEDEDDKRTMTSTTSSLKNEKSTNNDLYFTEVIKLNNELAKVREEINEERMKAKEELNEERAKFRADIDKNNNEWNEKSLKLKESLKEEKAKSKMYLIFSVTVISVSVVALSSMALFSNRNRRY